MVGSAGTQAGYTRLSGCGRHDPKYVERLIESASKRDLGAFFDDWVYHDRGLPDFHVQSVHPWKDKTPSRVKSADGDGYGGKSRLGRERRFLSQSAAKPARCNKSIGSPRKKRGYHAR